MAAPVAAAVYIVLNIQKFLRIPNKINAKSPRLFSRGIAGTHLSTPMRT